MVSTGIGLWPAASATVIAPWPGEIVERGIDSFVLRGFHYQLAMTGVAAVTPTSRVHMGEPLAIAVADRWCDVGVSTVGTAVPPRFTTAELASGWLVQFPRSAPAARAPRLGTAGRPRPVGAQEQ